MTMGKLFSALKMNIVLLLALSVIAGCGTGGLTDASSTDDDGAGAGPGASPASIDLLVSNSQLNSDGASTVTLTALVMDNGNNAMAGQTVTFAAESGILAVVSSVTNASGQATATLGTGGDPENRSITVTAAAGSKSATNT